MTSMKDEWVLIADELPRVIRKTGSPPAAFVKMLRQAFEDRAFDVRGVHGDNREPWLLKRDRTLRYRLEPLAGYAVRQTPASGVFNLRHRPRSTYVPAQEITITDLEIPRAALALLEQMAQGLAPVPAPVAEPTEAAPATVPAVVPPPWERDPPEWQAAQREVLTTIEDEGWPDQHERGAQARFARMIMEGAAQQGREIGEKTARRRARSLLEAGYDGSRGWRVRPNGSGPD